MYPPLPLLLLITPFRVAPDGGGDVHGWRPARTPPFAKVPRPVKLFLPQSTLEEWAGSDQADVRDQALVLSGETAKFPVEPAVHMKALVSGPDEHQLLKKVKTEAQLAELGAERLADSVVAGDTAYDVVSGYLVQVPDQAPAPTETALLADYLLNKL